MIDKNTLFHRKSLFVISTSYFKEITFKLDPRYCSGKTFTIRTHNNSAENMYVQSASLNGKPLNRAWLRHAEVVAGGVLELDMGPKPNKSWGSAPKELPPRNFPPSLVISRSETSRR